MESFRGDSSPVEIEGLFLSIVIPCFNEHQRIEPTLKTVVEHLDRRPWTSEIVVVDDGSIDDTGQVAAAVAYGDGIRVLRFDSNHGKGWALRTGFNESRGKLVLFCDADLSTPIDELDQFIARIEQGYDIVVASRAARGTQLSQPLIRRLVGRGFRSAVRAFKLTKVADTQCGFKLLQRERVAHIIDGMQIAGFAFDVELLARAEIQGLQIFEQAVTWKHVRGSKLHILRDGIRSLLDLIRVRFMVTSLRRREENGKRNPRR